MPLMYKSNINRHIFDVPNDVGVKTSECPSHPRCGFNSRGVTTACSVNTFYLVTYSSSGCRGSVVLLYFCYSRHKES